MRRLALLVVLASPVLASCGSTTKTVTQPAASTSSTPFTATSSTAATTTSTTAAPVFFQGVAGAPAQRPATLELTGDGTLFVKDVQWTAWGGPQATGSGNAEYHGCTPNCAQAPSHIALVSIRLSGIRLCGGRNYYAGATLTLSSGQLLDPEFMQRSWSPC